MFVVDSECMRRMDAASIAAGVPSLTLMERAGTGATRTLLERPRWLLGTTLVLCGRGNNGGDGLVVARLLHGRSHRVEVLLACERSALGGDAAVNLERAEHAGVSIRELGADPAAALVRLAAEHPGRLAVDALLGTGFQPPLRAPYSDLVAALHGLGRRVVAMDCPSGLDTTTGAADPHCAPADLTVTFGFPKWGFYLGAGRPLCGRIERVDLEFPREIVDPIAASTPSTGLFVDRTLASGWWRPRPVDAHKYRAGAALAVGGSAGMSGAIALAATAAYRAGAGLVQAAVPGAQRVVVDTLCVETLVHGQPETESGSLSPQAMEPILRLAERAHAVLLGPGGGSDLQTARLFVDLMRELDKPLVVDADALNAMHRLQTSPRYTTPCILTPHSGELARLLGSTAAEIAPDRRRVIRQASRDWNAVLLHKGAPTMVASPDGTLAVIGAGGPSLATAGTGDVLAGALVALLAAGYPPFEAACLGAYLHGRAGDRAAERRGVAGTLARDVLDELAGAVFETEEWHR